MKTIFISGPMTGLTEYNYPEFNRIAAHLRKVGYNVVNPAETGFHDGWSWKDYMKVALIQLMTNDVDIMFMLEGWQESKGARIENYVAKEFGIQIMYQSRKDLGGETEMDEKFELDENLDIEKTKLPNIDQFFHGDPVTEYVKAAIDVLQGKEGAEAELEEAAQKVYESQKERGLIDEDEEYENLYEYIYDLDGIHAAEINEALDLIEEELDNKTEFDERDLELVKYYFKHLPGNSSHAIDALSDNALALAWRQKQFIRHVFSV